MNEKKGTDNYCHLYPISLIVEDMVMLCSLGSTYGAVCLKETDEPGDVTGLPNPTVACGTYSRGTTVEWARETDCSFGFEPHRQTWRFFLGLTSA
jgi:hypothetical protein